MHWQPVLQTFIYQRLFKRLRGLGEADPQVVAEALPKFEKLARILDVLLKSQSWVCGEKITIADLTPGAYLVYASPANVPLDKFPHVLTWWSRLSERPSWAAAQEGALRGGN